MVELMLNYFRGGPAPRAVSLVETLQQRLPGPIDALERALGSRAMTTCFQVIAGGTGSPTAIAESLALSKHAVSQHIAGLREAGPIP